MPNRPKTFLEVSLETRMYVNDEINREIETCFKDTQMIKLKLATFSAVIEGNLHTKDSRAISLSVICLNFPIRTEPSIDL